jgi:tRNA modification GTPase
MPLHIIDTAGLRDTQDRVEQEGVRRAKEAIKQADLVLHVVDNADKEVGPLMLETDLPVLTVKNKIDLKQLKAKAEKDTIYLSAKTGEGVDLLEAHLKTHMGFDRVPEGAFIARRRHLDAIARTAEAIKNGLNQLQQQSAGELLAEDLRSAQNALSEVTGTFTSEDLLGEIFGSFCIGK